MLRICPACAKGVWPGEARGRHCPHCGHQLQRSVAVRAGIALAMVLAVVIGLALFGSVLDYVHRDDPAVAATARGP